MPALLWQGRRQHAGRRHGCGGRDRGRGGRTRAACIEADQDGTKVGDYYLTCDDQGQKPTGKVVSTGNAGEVVSGAASIGAGLLLTKPLDYTAEIP